MFTGLKSKTNSDGHLGCLFRSFKYTLSILYSRMLHSKALEGVRTKDGGGHFPQKKMNIEEIRFPQCLALPTYANRNMATGV